MRHPNLLAALATTLLAACSAAPAGDDGPVEGGEGQAQTGDTFALSTIGAGPDAFDHAGSHIVGAGTLADGTLVAAYPNESTKLTLATRVSGVWKSQVIKSDSKAGRDLDLKVDPSGAIHILHYDETVRGVVHSVRPHGQAAFVHTTVLANGSDAVLAFAKDGTGHALMIEWPSQALSYASLAPGGTWKTEKIRSDGKYRRPYLSIDDSGHAVLSAGLVGPSGNASLVLGKRVGTWTFETPNVPINGASAIAVRGGKTHVVYGAPENGNGYDGAFQYIVREEGGSFSPPEEIAWSGYYPDLRILPSGQPEVLLTVAGTVQRYTRGEDAAWLRTEVTSSQGTLRPRFVGETSDVVFSDRWSKNFRFAALQAR